MEAVVALYLRFGLDCLWTGLVLEWLWLHGSDKVQLWGAQLGLGPAITSSAKLGPALLGSAWLGLAWPSSAGLSLPQLGTAELGWAWLSLAQSLGLARLDSAQGVGWT